MPSTRLELQQSIAQTVRDYRHGAVPAIDAARVGRWVSQFPSQQQDAILQELSATLPRIYYSRDRVNESLTGLVTTEKLTGSDPCAFWRTATLLNLPLYGDSQRDLLRILQGAITRHCGSPPPAQGDRAGPFIYIDDGIFTGITLIRGIKSWLPTAPREIKLHVIAIGIYRAGREYARRELTKAAGTLGKSLDLTFWGTIAFENGADEINNSDVLWPNHIPPEAEEYANSLQPYYPRLRTGTSIGLNGAFTTHDGRVTLEQEFLKAG